MSKKECRKLNFSAGFFFNTQILKFYKNQSTEAELFQTDGPTNVTKIIFAFRIFMNKLNESWCVNNMLCLAIFLVLNCLGWNLLTSSDTHSVYYSVPYGGALFGAKLPGTEVGHSFPYVASLKWSCGNCCCFGFFVLLWLSFVLLWLSYVYCCISFG
jgi:hypothetical protein